MLPTIQNGAVQVSGEIDWRQLGDKFIDSIDASERTVQEYAKNICSFIDWLPTDRPERETVLQYKQHLIDRELKPHSVNAYLTAVRRFFSFLESVLVYPDIAKSIKGMKTPKRNTKDGLTGDQCRRLVNTIPTAGTLSRRDYALLNLLIRTGIRTIEAQRADIADIRNQGGETVLFVHGKGRDSKDDFVVLTAEALNPILDYLASRGAVKDSEPLFVSYSNNGRGKGLTTRSIRRIVAKHLGSAGLKNDRVSAHSLRHSFVTLAIEGGADLPQVQASARHSSPETTMRYFHNKDRLQNAGEKAVRF